MYGHISITPSQLSNWRPCSGDLQLFLVLGVILLAGKSSTCYRLDPRCIKALDQTNSWIRSAHVALHMSLFNIAGSPALRGWSLGPGQGENGGDYGGDFIDKHAARVVGPVRLTESLWLRIDCPSGVSITL